MTETIEQRMRRWLLEEATRNGPEVHTTSGPFDSSNTWRYPYWPAQDVAWEEER